MTQWLHRPTRKETIRISVPNTHATRADYPDALRTEGRALERGALDRAARIFPAPAAEIAARGQAAHQEGLIPAPHPRPQPVCAGGGGALVQVG